MKENPKRAAFLSPLGEGASSRSQLRETSFPRKDHASDTGTIVFDGKTAEREERRAREKKLGERISLGRDAYLAEQRAKVASEGKTEEEITEQMEANIRADKGSHLRGADALTARNELVESHLPLVKHVAFRFRNGGFDIEDLEQEATMGLIGAAERFEPERGLVFSTFATATMKGELQRLLQRKAPLAHFDRVMQELRAEVYHLDTELEQRNGGRVSEHELAEELLRRRSESDDEKPSTKNQRGNEMEALLPKIAIVRRGEILESFDAPVGKDMAPLSEKLKDEEDVAGTVAEKDIVDRIFHIIKTSKALTPQQKRILELRFTTDKSQLEIGEDPEVGYSQMHVSRMITKGLNVIKEELGDVTDY